jgi:hypothetical protein
MDWEACIGSLPNLLVCLSRVSPPIAFCTPQEMKGREKFTVAENCVDFPRRGHEGAQELKVFS